VTGTGHKTHAYSDAGTRRMTIPHSHEEEIETEAQRRMLPYHTFDLVHTTPLT
jgi:hypothetical protein